MQSGAAADLAVRVVLRLPNSRSRRFTGADAARGVP